jgi:hypothetical protein
MLNYKFVIRAHQVWLEKALGQVGQLEETMSNYSGFSNLTCQIKRDFTGRMF